MTPQKEKDYKMPIRYFVINAKTHIMHIHGFCQQTKPRSVPIRLFDSQEELIAYAGRPLTLCRVCKMELESLK